MIASQIRMYGKNDIHTSGVIDEIYVTGGPLEGFYKKEFLHWYMKQCPGKIHVVSYPNTLLIPVERSEVAYVRTIPNRSQKDNLSALPKTYQ